MHTDEQILESLLDQFQVTAEQVEAARARHPDLPVLAALQEDGAVQPRTIHETIAGIHGLSFIDLNDQGIAGQIQELKPLVPEEVAQRHSVLPLRQTDHGLQVAIADPMNFEAFDTVPFMLKTEVEFLYADPSAVDRLLKEIYPARVKISAGTGAQEADVIKLVNEFLYQAQRMRASDIHLEPVEPGFRVRFRVDGELYQYNNGSLLQHYNKERVYPASLHGAVVSTLKIMTQTMSIDEKRVPQDGRIQHELKDEHGHAVIDAKTQKPLVLDLRVSTIPTSQGESVVMRLLDQSTLSITLPDLGFMSDDQEYFRGLIKLADGIILVTGPTGSGKTTTLYACLSEINDESRKIITAEDPIEYVMPGVNQVHVKSEIGMTFARALRSMLRQAPNVIMIGEIRDLETAGIAINASLTGHLVLSTLHTNDAPSAIARLIDIGVKPFLVSSAVRAVMAQRLCRKLCTCKEPATLTEAEMVSLKLDPDQLASAKIYKPKGCERCRFTGYKGRLGIFEIFKVDDEMRQMINRMGDAGDRSEQVSTVQLRKRAREQGGMRTLREDGFQKVFAGLTTFDEVLAVTMGDSD